MVREVDFTGHRVRPPHVVRAILTDDKERLSEYGRRGAATRKRLAVSRKAAQNRTAHRTQQEAAKRAAEDAALHAFHLEMIAEDDARYFRELHEECHFGECPID